jgi:hypothetical protein
MQVTTTDRVTTDQHWRAGQGLLVFSEISGTAQLLKIYFT